MRIVLLIGGNTLIANDVPAALGPMSENENRSKISVDAKSREEAERIFAGLSVDGDVEMPMDKSPRGTYFAMFRDKYGLSGRWSLILTDEHSDLSMSLNSKLHTCACVSALIISDDEVCLSLKRTSGMSAAAKIRSTSTSLLRLSEESWV